MTVKNIPLAVLFASFAFWYGAQSAQAQVAPSPTAQLYAIHDDLLKCYVGLGKSVETETEYKWLLAQRPSNAPYHFNYALFLQHAGRKGPAAVEYEKAAMYDGSNVDFVGSAGQMFFFMGQYTKAYQYLGKAMQMPGGDKYRASCESCRTYLQNIAQTRANAAQAKAGAAAGGSGASKGKAKDDDDD
jgi:tetratricopeptide (TPR) repeat protein